MVQYPIRTAAVLFIVLVQLYSCTRYSCTSTTAVLQLCSILQLYVYYSCRSRSTAVPRYSCTSIFFLEVDGYTLLFSTSIK